GPLSERMAERIRRGDPRNETRTNTLVTRVEASGDRVTAVWVRRVPSTRKAGQLAQLATGRENDGNPYHGVDAPEERIACDSIVNTAPLPALVDLLGEAASAEAKAAARRLRFSAITIVGLRIMRPNGLAAPSISFPRKSFHRRS